MKEDEQVFNQNKALSTKFDEKMALKQFKQKQVEDLYIKAKSLEQQNADYTESLKAIELEMEQLMTEIRQLDAECRAILASYEQHSESLVTNIRDKMSKSKHPPSSSSESPQRSVCLLILYVLALATAIVLFIGGILYNMIVIIVGASLVALIMIWFFIVSCCTQLRSQKGQSQRTAELVGMADTTDIRTPLCEKDNT